MIRVYARGLSLELRGHAGAGKKGSDPICAACSMLALLLAENLEQMAKQGWLKELHLCLESGNGSFSCIPAPGAEGGAALLFGSVAEGFRLLAKKYPQWVEFHGDNRKIWDSPPQKRRKNDEKTI